MFYSAANVAAIQDVRRIAKESSRNDSGYTHAIDGKPHPIQQSGNHVDSGDDESHDTYYAANETDKNIQDPRATILSATELELTFVKSAPDLSGIYEIH